VKRYWTEEELADCWSLPTTYLTVIARDPEGVRRALEKPQLT
jgi:hypothetical protein